MRKVLLAGLVAVCGCSGDSTPTAPTGNAQNPLSFFVTSATSTTGNLGGLAGADATCQRLAESVGQGNRFWRAYLSAERDPAANNQPVNARDRIGVGPWHNANGVLIANNIAELHARTGNADLFIDERGQKVNGQWTGSPTPNQHDILTGSDANGNLMTGFTCADWTSSAAAQVAQVGHSDGFGVNQSTAGTAASWNSAHANQNCADTAPRGGGGKFYCFAR